MTPNEPSSPSFILSSPLAQRLDEGVWRHYRIRAERSRSQRHREGLKGEYGAELENGDHSVAMEGEDDGWTDEKRKGWTGREGVEVCEESPRSAGRNASAATSLSRGSGTDTASFNPIVFVTVPDMVPYPVGASAIMKRQVISNSQANESQEVLRLMCLKASMDTMDMFGGKSKVATLTASSPTATMFNT
jgi:hypothetical protein